MKRFTRTMLAMAAVLMVSGCGNQPLVELGAFADKPVAQVTAPEQGPEGPEGPPGETGPAGPPGLAGPSDVLSWGLFLGVSTPEVRSSGGLIDILSFIRTAEGVYEIEYDIPTNQLQSAVVPIGSATGDELREGEVVGSIFSWGFIPGKSNLTVEVFLNATILDPNFVILAPVDGNFSLALFGQ